MKYQSHRARAQSFGHAQYELNVSLVHDIAENVCKILEIFANVCRGEWRLYAAETKITKSNMQLAKNLARQNFEVSNSF